MAEETKIVVEQMARMNDFYMWSVSIFITLILTFVGFISFLQLRLSEKDKKQLYTNINNRISEENKKIERTFLIKERLRDIEHSFDYYRTLFYSYQSSDFKIISGAAFGDTLYNYIDRIESVLLDYHQMDPLHKEEVELRLPELKKYCDTGMFFIKIVIDGDFDREFYEEAFIESLNRVIPALFRVYNFEILDIEHEDEVKLEELKEKLRLYKKLYNTKKLEE